MTVRAAELLMAVALAFLSIGFMAKSADGLSIGWVEGAGPGAGAWPFWLSALMLLSCLTIIWRWFRGATPQSRSAEPFMDRHALTIVGITVLSLILLVFGLGTIGLYASLFLFLLFYVRVIGRHSLVLALSMAVLSPVVLFLFFEWALVIPLPKGITEPLFFPIYAIIY